MPFPPPKKKSGGAVFAIDLEPPEPFDKKREPNPMKREAPPMRQEEAESPQEEASEDYGAKLIADIESAGAELGMDADMSRRAAGSFFSAAAKCLQGDSGEEQQAPMQNEERGNRMDGEY